MGLLQRVRAAAARRRGPRVRLASRDADSVERQQLEQLKSLRDVLDRVAHERDTAKAKCVVAAADFSEASRRADAAERRVEELVRDRDRLTAERDAALIKATRAARDATAISYRFRHVSERVRRAARVR